MAVVASLAVSVSVVGSPPAPSVAAGSTTYLVTNTSGDPAVAGSLPWAVLQANYVTQGFDRIRFDLPLWPYQEIVLTQPLWINDQVDITGPLTESMTPAIGLRGNDLAYLFIMQSDPARGVTSSSSTIAGLGMIGFNDAAIITKPEAQGIFIQRNWIGFANAPDFGVGPISNRDVLPGALLADGIEINSSYNTVRYNRFAFIDYGVILGGRVFPGNVVKTNSVQRNWFGANTDNSSLTGDAVFLWDGAQENFIGPLNSIESVDGVGVELVHASNKLNVIFDNDIFADLAGIAIGGGGVGNAVGGPFGGNRVTADLGLVLGFGVKNAAFNTWVEGNTFRGVSSSSFQGSIGALIQGGSTGNFLGSNGFLELQVGVFLGDEVARGTGKNAVNGNRFGATFGGCEWQSTQYALYFSYSNYNFARDNGATNPYYYQYRSRGNSISISQICSNPVQRVEISVGGSAPLVPPDVTLGQRTPG